MSLSYFSSGTEQESVDTPAETPDAEGSGPYGETAGRRVSELAPGDVVLFTRLRIHGLLRASGDYTEDATDAPIAPERMDIEWLDGYDIGNRTCGVRRVDLEELATQGKIRLIAAAVANRMSRWAIEGARCPDQYDRDTGVQPMPRVRAANTMFRREYSRDIINGFLKHPVVDHKLGRVQKVRAMFGARRPDGHLSAVATVAVPNARQASDRRTVEITRYASHPEDATGRERYPNGTGTRMLAQICRWAALEGFERVRALAGTAGNDGGIYRGANFRDDGDAASSGNYNRTGRTNYDHETTLTRYIREVSADGSDATPGTPRRVESRYDGAEADVVTAQTGLSRFGSSYRGDASPNDLALVREEVSDYKFATDEQYPAYSRRARKLFATYGRPGAREVLAGETAGRGRYFPAAIFGGDDNGTLAVALAVTGNPREPFAEAEVIEYAARETAFPAATARWILARVRDWARLDGYDALTVPATLFDHIEGVAPSVPAGVGFEKGPTGEYRIVFSG